MRLKPGGQVQTFKEDIKNLSLSSRAPLTEPPDESNNTEKNKEDKGLDRAEKLRADIHKRQLQEVRLRLMETALKLLERLKAEKKLHKFRSNVTLSDTTDCCHHIAPLRQKLHLTSVWRHRSVNK